MKPLGIGTHNRIFLNILLQGGSLSPLEALNRFGCMRLGARKYDLEKIYGYPTIECDPEPNKGHGKHARYYFTESNRLLALALAAERGDYDLPSGVPFINTVSPNTVQAAV